LIGWSVGWSVGHGEVTRTSRCLFSFVTRARPSRPFYTLRAIPKTALNFGRSVGRSWGSHTNVTLPLQFHHPGPLFPTLLRPAGHSQNGLKFWLVGWSVDWSVGRSVGRSVSRLVTGKSNECHAASFSFFTRARPSRSFYAQRATPKTALNFGRSVGWLVGHGEFTRTSRCFFSFVTQARHFRPFYALRDTPKRP
jgi:hypothetical protein